MKRGQGLSLNTIIIAAIVLLVLVIIVIIFTGRMGQWSMSTQDCEKQSGNCIAVSGSLRECPTGYTEHPTWKCFAEDGSTTEDICCIEART